MAKVVLAIVDRLGAAPFVVADPLAAPPLAVARVVLASDRGTIVGGAGVLAVVPPLIARIGCDSGGAH
jgi:hypothetical protein